MATSCTFGLNFILMTISCRITNTLNYFDFSMRMNWQKFADYIRLGLVNSSVEFFDFIGTESMVIFAGLLPQIDTACMVILLNIQILIYQVPYGMSFPISGYVGKYIGKNKLEKGKDFSLKI